MCMIYVVNVAAIYLQIFSESNMFQLVRKTMSHIQQPSLGVFHIIPSTWEKRCASPKCLLQLHVDKMHKLDRSCQSCRVEQKTRLDAMDSCCGFLSWIFFSKLCDFWISNSSKEQSGWQYRWYKYDCARESKCWHTAFKNQNHLWSPRRLLITQGCAGKYTCHFWPVSFPTCSAESPCPSNFAKRCELFESCHCRGRCTLLSAHKKREMNGLFLLALAYYIHCFFLDA